jgi:hypothetical protein
MTRHFVMLKLDGPVYKAPQVPDCLKSALQYKASFVKKTKPGGMYSDMNAAKYTNQFWVAKLKFKSESEAVGFALKFSDYVYKIYEG